MEADLHDVAYRVTNSSAAHDAFRRHSLSEAA